jgi:hypothetical protein
MPKFGIGLALSMSASGQIQTDFAPKSSSLHGLLLHQKRTAWAVDVLRPRLRLTHIDAENDSAHRVCFSIVGPSVDGV